MTLTGSWGLVRSVVVASLVTATTTGVGVLSVPDSLTAQDMDGSGVVATGLLLRRMEGVKRVLMIGAHPDDEDTSLLTALARGEGVETAYLALTRGDGGQNLIGPQLWEGLGIIRTGELESARALDGGRQFFTRAFDFGYSKRADEALAAWPREELLEDVVWVIRSFRPQVIVAVFTGTPADGHGQHQASGMMAREAFAAAGDPTRFPHQLREGVEAWTPLKLFQLMRRRPQEASTSVVTGDLDPLLGRSHFQLSMDSRSRHRSQDMGAAQTPGPRASGLDLLESRVGGPADQDVFQGIDTTLAGTAAGISEAARGRVVAHLDAYLADVRRARDSFSLVDRTGTALPLASALRHLQMASAAAGGHAPIEFSTTLERKMGIARRAFLSAAGIVVDVRADDDLVVPGQALEVEVTLWNGGAAPLGSASAALDVPEGWVATPVSVAGVEPDGTVGPDRLARWTYSVALPPDADVSRLYYLQAPRDGARYRWPDRPDLWGLPRDPAPVAGAVSFRVDGGGAPVEVHHARPWSFVGVDKAKGEFRRPVLTVPALSLSVSPGMMAWPAGLAEHRTVTVQLGSQAPESVEGEVVLEGPTGWTVSPAGHPFSLTGPGQERTFVFDVTPSGTVPPGDHVFRAVARSSSGRSFGEGYEILDFEHIERAALFTPAEMRTSVFPVAVRQDRAIGYVMGSGDDGFEVLRQMGARVELVDPARVREGDFSGYDAIVLGVRAYETRPDLAAANDALLEFARSGGTVVVQYNKFEYPDGGYAPYPVAMSRPAARVAEEDAPVRMLDPEAPIFTAPNRITASDFDGWVHERGLYFLSEWGEPFVPVLEMSDPGEEPQRGSTVIAPVGEGVYVYSALAFFRQFPAGVPGAYRLFANLVSLTPEEWAGYQAGR